MESIGFRCPSCGSPVVWDAAKGKMYCSYCDNTYEPEEVETNYDENDVVRSQDIHNPPDEDVSDTYHKTYDETEYDSLVMRHCESCGAELITSAVTSASTCAYCGSTMIITKQLTGIYRPHYVLPFVYPKEQALSMFTNHLNKPLTSKAFLNEISVDKIQGIYIPYWLYNGNCYVNATYHTSESAGNSHRETTISNLITCIRNYIYPFKRLPVNASSKTSDELMESLEPFDYSKIKVYMPQYLAGYLAERYDADEDGVSNKAKYRILNSVRKSTIKSCSNGMSRPTVIEQDFNASIQYDKIEYVLLPIWLLHCTYKKTKYTFAMNGQTGKFSGNPPISRVKSGAISYIIATITFIITVMVAYFKL